MPHIDLMARYPKSDRSKLLSEREAVSEEDRKIARRFGQEYFDGPRHLGMGGYHYDQKYFSPVVEDMIDHYNLEHWNSVLDVGCGKGFMLHDFRVHLPGMRVGGVDISDYCVSNSMPSVMPFIVRASCDALPYPDDHFDLVVSIATIHNLDLDGVKRSLEEIMRVKRKHAYIKVNGYYTIPECLALHRWNLVAETIMHASDWIKLFEEVGYDGDYSFFTP